MPRPSAAGRKSQNNRHENGLVGPGKKVTKQKSSSQLNGSPSNGSATGSGASLLDLSANRSSSDTQILAPTTANQGTDELGVDGNVRGVVNGHSKGVDMACGQANGAAAHNGGIAGSSSRNGHGNVKRSGSNASINPLQLASTILKSCPMYDTIAILIFLLQLPPMVLTMVQFLFASLTFMPPQRCGRGLAIFEFRYFSGSGWYAISRNDDSHGWLLPSFLGPLHVDVGPELCNRPCSRPSRLYPWRRRVRKKWRGQWSLCWDCSAPAYRQQQRHTRLCCRTSRLAKLISPDVLTHYSNLLPAEFRRTEPPTSPSWLRSLLAIHILAQAGTAMARRSMARNRSPAPSRSGKRVDTEASAGSQGQADSALESAASLSSSFIGPDGQLKDGKDRFISAKKRRRQANQVRSRQPFWAALASTKVTVMREYEHSRTCSKTARGLPMTETDLQGVSLDDGLVWITDVESSSIKFAAGDVTDDSTISNSCDSQVDGDMEPFYVCVNGALWATATIGRVEDSTKGPNMVQWRGEISGLAPNCAYTCTFVRSDTDEEICSMSVKTPATTDAEQSESSGARSKEKTRGRVNRSNCAAAVSVVPTPPQPHYRPSSPTTTLKNSIINAESKLNEKRSRLKKAKNDHKLLISKIRKELDNYNNRLQSGTDENKQKQRSLQLERNIKQTEEATVMLEAQLDSMETVPEEEMEQWTAQKSEFDRELERLNGAKEEVQNARLAMAQQASALESELSMVIQKRERLQSRRTRVNEQYERIISANAQGLNERERRAAEQFAREQDQAKLEASFHEQFGSITQSVQDFQLRTNQLWQQASAIEQSIQQQQQQMLMETGPLTPEGNLPGTNPLAEANMPATTAPATRSHLGLSFAPARSSPLQHDSSPGHASLSHPTSPVQDAPPQFPASPFANATSYFANESSRDRSFSNRSARSSLYGSDYFEAKGIPPFQLDLSELLSEKHRSGSEPNSLLFQSGRPMLSPFQRAASRGSGAGSGSASGSGGSGSGSGSPRSTREQ
ncbi:hypothetical protein N7468_010210 [Penicillium chermesinum]|uniref:Ubiquitination network signaling protein acrB n=1 Tax=Penicillium chermesinum TaxID=63820 RepID=A0A9W9TC16_9EURO|nr:uncharacterized protein N7468_010210 [Penicillium chermesinum]KAJ5217202.1 hypothetical protein N7468_010210 [Penicillium chermesinum]